MIRHMLLVSLMTTIAITGCSRKSDTHDPDTTQKPEAEVVEETTVVEEDTSAPDYSAPSSTGDTGSANDNTSDSGDASGTAGDTDSSSAESPNSEGQLICNATWFEWVNSEVMKTQSEAITEHYPSGLPLVGSDDWFIAMDKLTGGDGAHGPDGGSDEWCFMMQQRLNKTD
ncbi:hypothetical protein [Microbulbifer sp. HZ11]|uniref:hypothetical protein n=1 Tax=Microbulbifer sp. HZ11 TaxID=1453501 RepID=UPI0005B8EFAA|nr:hypothetical protein [Microbulbifer sp. HZ11]